MRELKMDDLDAELAEQLPARELTGRSCHRSVSHAHGHLAVAGNNNGRHSVCVQSGNQTQVLSEAGSNGNFASVGLLTRKRWALMAWLLGE